MKNKTVKMSGSTVLIVVALLYFTNLFKKSKDVGEDLIEDLDEWWANFRWDITVPPGQNQAVVDYWIGRGFSAEAMSYLVEEKFSLPLLGPISAQMGYNALSSGFYRTSWSDVVKSMSLPDRVWWSSAGLLLDVLGWAAHGDVMYSYEFADAQKWAVANLEAYVEWAQAYGYVTAPPEGV